MMHQFCLWVILMSGKFPGQAGINSNFRRIEAFYRRMRRYTPGGYFQNHVTSFGSCLTPINRHLLLSNHDVLYFTISQPRHNRLKTISDYKNDNFTAINHEIALSWIICCLMSLNAHWILSGIYLKKKIYGPDNLLVHTTHFFSLPQLFVVQEILETKKRLLFRASEWV